MVDDDCCKGTPYPDRMSLYMLNIRLTESKTSDGLCVVLGYTKKQSEIAKSMTLNMGECLIFEGSEDDVISHIVALNKYGISCQARSTGNFK